MKGTMIFQYVSDLHLEYYCENMNKIRRLFIDPMIKRKVEVGASFLLLAGDVGRPTSQSYSTFLKELAPHYDRIFVTTGNHEYYKMPYDTLAELDDKCREVCSEAGGNIVFLQNERYDIDDKLSIYGGTFWTQIPVQKRHIVGAYVNDYRYIPNFTTSNSSAMHETAISQLKAEMEKDPERQWIVMSHHMPSFDLIDDKYKNDPKNADINFGFASEIELARDDRIHAWVYGHTHTPCQKGKFYCNPIGYPGERNEDWRKFCTTTFTYP
jgi:predicted phosphodiesterase